VCLMNIFTTFEKAATGNVFRLASLLNDFLGPIFFSDPRGRLDPVELYASQFAFDLA
jgi:hypothetical protein